jgi:hypothetical protein
MSRFWFSYCDHSGRLLAGLVMDSPSPLEARKCAAAAADAGARYCEGYELDPECANLIPAEAIGRMLNREEVRELAHGLETRVIPKQPVRPRRSLRTSTREPQATSNTGPVSVICLEHNKRGT